MEDKKLELIHELQECLVKASEYSPLELGLVIDGHIQSINHLTGTNYEPTQIRNTVPSAIHANIVNAIDCLYQLQNIDEYDSNFESILEDLENIDVNINERKK